MSQKSNKQDEYKKRLKEIEKQLKALQKEFAQIKTKATRVMSGQKDKEETKKVRKKLGLK